jgi:hypothetical protein
MTTKTLWLTNVASQHIDIVEKHHSNLMFAKCKAISVRRSNPRLDAKAER